MAILKFSVFINFMRDLFSLKKSGYALERNLCRESWYLKVVFICVSSGLSSFKKFGNGQGGQSRINPASLGSETSVTTDTSRAMQNEAHGQPLSHCQSNLLFPISLLSTLVAAIADVIQAFEFIYSSSLRNGYYVVIYLRLFSTF